LEISSNTSKDEIRTAYRKKCQEVHPDRVHGTPLEAPATVIFRTINEAYETLMANSVHREESKRKEKSEHKHRKDHEKREEEKRKQAEKKLDLERFRKRAAKFQSCISASSLRTVGLKADGTVVAVGFNEWGSVIPGN